QLRLVDPPVPQQRFPNGARTYRIMKSAVHSTRSDPRAAPPGGTGGGSEHDAGRLGRIEFTWRAGASSPAHASDSISRVNSDGHTSKGLSQQHRAFGADLLTTV